MRTLSGLLLLILLSSSSRAICAEATPAAEAQLEGQPLSHWLKQLSADEFGVREAATEVLCKASSEIVQPLKDFGRDSDDLEVQRRIAKVLAAVEEVSFEGQFFVQAHTTLDSRGNERLDNTRDDVCTLEISPGQVIWTRKKGDNHAIQTYRFAEDLPLRSKGGREIPLKFEKMDSNWPTYSPDRKNPKLIIANSPQGTLITLQATDERGTTGRATFGSKQITAAERDSSSPPPEGIEMDDLPEVIHAQ